MLSYKDKVKILPTYDNLYESNVRKIKREKVRELFIPKNVKRQLGTDFNLTQAHINCTTDEITAGCGNFIMRWDLANERFRCDRLPRDHSDLFYCDYYNKEASENDKNLIYGSGSSFWLANLEK